MQFLIVRRPSPLRISDCHCLQIISLSLLSMNYLTVPVTEQWMHFVYNLLGVIRLPLSNACLSIKIWNQLQSVKSQCDCAAVHLWHRRSPTVRSSVSFNILSSSYVWVKKNLIITIIILIYNSEEAKRLHLAITTLSLFVRMWCWLKLVWWQRWKSEDDDDDIDSHRRLMFLSIVRE